MTRTALPHSCLHAEHSWQACLMGMVEHKSSTDVFDLSTACSPVCLGACVQVQEAKSVLIQSGQLPDEAANLAEQVQELSVN